MAGRAARFLKPIGGGSLNHLLVMLSDRERDVLRLLSRGHDTKSAAGVLGLSVHTINDHLRSARGKLGVQSNREAARHFAEYETIVPQKNRDDVSGIGVQPVTADADRRTGQSVRTLIAISGGAVMLSLIALVTAIHGYDAGSSSWKTAVLASPKIVSTVPTSGSVIRSGPFVLSVTFDRPMLDRSYSFVQTSSETYPQCDNRPLRSADGRTFSMQCTATAGRRYEIGFNRPPYMNFKSAAGEPATPSTITFSSARR